MLLSSSGLRPAEWATLGPLQRGLAPAMGRMMRRWPQSLRDVMYKKPPTSSSVSKKMRKSFMIRDSAATRTRDGPVRRSAPSFLMYRRCNRRVSSSLRAEAAGSDAPGPLLLYTDHDACRVPTVAPVSRRPRSACRTSYIHQFQPEWRPPQLRWRGGRGARIRRSTAPRGAARADVPE